MSNQSKHFTNIFNQLSEQGIKFIEHIQAMYLLLLILLDIWDTIYTTINTLALIIYFNKCKY